MSEREQLPLYNQLLRHAEKCPRSFHVPGHKYGRVFPEVGQAYFSKLLALDATELTGLDDLHAPTEAIQEAQQLTAELYGASQSYFLVGGSTAGNLAMILATCQPGDVVLVQRNSHKSIINGLKLANVTPIFLTPSLTKDAQMGYGVTYDTVEKAIYKYPEAKALLLTNPNYFGMTVNVREMVKLAHQNNVAVLVDEAHGAHFGIGEPFPDSALAAGADLVVHSAHKTLPAMTMASFLHYNSSLVRQEKVEECLELLQSSSPSYPLMASLDLARYYLRGVKGQGISKLVENLHKFKQMLVEIPQVEVLEGEENRYVIDPLKITLRSRCALSGFQIQALLEQQGIYTELADPDHVLFVMPLADEEVDTMVIDTLSAHLSSYDVKSKDTCQQSMEGPAMISALELNYRIIETFKTKRVALADSVGKVSAENIIPYPPGIPLIMKGERIESEQLKRLQILLAEGARFQNKQVSDGLLIVDIDK
ncbi:aminotransferase class I/II-fold pyridoxal phosphate-dependent enzyme [Desertibacillus haloalkaliphilus]|uniref:aminotransferase class I/II-fold pyridoxal phosphate-dependent enzyme n=1 Tax=Desertibacillus haloalkaliphilus TaxID=1328930 RepID=UPI001C2757A5|nr:aminotransferase class I/II-fold pyridoxal phosphate-dependent enzyme [Desertibacillus haloalkaliphilus]MBU8908405.1 aminotransferase class I/II-fold pyridoxal phosphate-dependent enzyme [Desertibacillus haloalkaliphilus]